MNFFLGTHQVCWLERLTVPLFVSRRRLFQRKSLPRAVCDWALDSGGFSELSLYGEWSISPREYVAEVRRYREEIGRLLWAPGMDWMCEPTMLARTGLSVIEHQRRTTENFLELQELAPDVPWIPVLQGWAVDDYQRHWGHYEGEGISLTDLPLVGLGSVCRRQHMDEAERIVRSLQPLRLHGFGFKMTGLLRVGEVLASSDSLAWSLNARKREPLPGCRHRTCASCQRWALLWREKLLDCVDDAETIPRQLRLWWD